MQVGKLLASSLANLKMEMVLHGSPSYVPISSSSDVLRVRISKVINVHIRRRSTFLGMAKEDKLSVQVQVFHGRVRGGRSCMHAWCDTGTADTQCGTWRSPPRRHSFLNPS